MIRRGPAKRVCTLLWDRQRDTFELGQWMKGRIYEERCDLSPDGKYLIYFALNGRWDSETRGSWTAISKAPYLKAMRLYPRGDTWGGGGLFTSATTYWTNDPVHEPVEVVASPLQEDANVVDVRWPFGARLERDGWTLVERDETFSVFDRDLCAGRTLRKRRTWNQQAHEIVEASGAVEPQPAWEWADVDRDRLVWAEGGCLFASPLHTIEPTLLQDFNDMEFEPIPAPY